MKTYGDVDKGRILLLLYGGSGLLEIGMNQGSAAHQLKVEPGAVRFPQTMNAYFFKPIYQERIWGGQQALGTLRPRNCPSGKKIGESWELVDRPEACSEIESGPGIAPGHAAEHPHALAGQAAPKFSARGRPTSRAFPS